MAQTRRELMEALSRRNIQPAADPEPSSNNTVQSTLKYNLGEDAPLPKTMTPLKDPAAEDLARAIIEKDNEPDDDIIDVDLLIESELDKTDASSSTQASSEPPESGIKTKQNNLYRTSMSDKDTDYDMPSSVEYRPSRNSDIEELSQELSSDNSDNRSMWIKLIGGLIIAVVVIAVVVTSVLSKRTPASSDASSDLKKEQSSSSVAEIVQDPQLPEGVLALKNEQLSVDSDLYVDTITISKVVELRNGVAVCYFRGVPDNFKQLIYIPVTTAQYNEYDNGDVISINYNIISFEGNDFVVNPTLKENVK